MCVKGTNGIVFSRGSVSFLPLCLPSWLWFSWQRCAGRGRRRWQRQQHQNQRHRGSDCQRRHWWCRHRWRLRKRQQHHHRGGSRALCWWQRGFFCPRCVVAFSAPAAWLRFAAASAFRRPHISSWFSRFCLGLFIGCSARRGFSLRRGSRSHSGCLSFVCRLFQ